MMKKLLLAFAIFLSLTQNYAQKNAVWKKLIAVIPVSERIKTTPYSEDQQLYQLNLTQFKQSLINAPQKFSGQPGVAVEFPNATGALEKFQVWENSNFAPELQAEYPEIRAYVGKSLIDKAATINFSVSPSGIETIVFRADTGTEFIEPYTKDNSVYVFFDSNTRTTARLPFNCSTIETQLVQDLSNDSHLANRSNNQLYKTMRLALSCTGEYGAYFGGTVAGALSGMNATMTRVNGVFEKDIALHLDIITDDNLVIYTNGSTDPYSPGATGSGGAWNTELMNNLHTVLGDDAFDIGHLFGASGGGGNAGCIGCVCSNVLATGNGAEDSYKGSGFTSPSDNIPSGDNFDIDYVVHEMGHQLGSNHSFSHNTEGTGVNVEPGSGSTIMGYAGITSYDVQPHSDAYFTYRNIAQMQTNLNTKTCPVATVITNTPPVVSVGPNITIPKGTAYILKGTAIDAEGDTMTYCWEQNDSAGSSASGANSVASATKITGPNFRSFTPKSSPDRYMPAFTSVLAGTLTTMWESVNSGSRTSKFTFTARDNNVSGAQTGEAQTIVTTSSVVGPFTVTSQSTTGISWVAGSTETITWNVNNTTTLVGSTNVNILLSIDGGVTFPYVLAADTPNDGDELITVPNTTASTNCRIMIAPTANIYYAVNSKAFNIGYQIITTCNTYTYSTPFNLPDGATTFTVKPINVPTAGIISDVNITINATHPNLQNLVMVALRPGGTMSSLFNQQCTGTADMNVTFDAQGGTLTCASPTTGTYAPPTGFNMDTFNGYNQLGNWQFGFKDIVAGDTGSINAITLEVCSQTLQLLAATTADFQDFALYPNPSNGSFNMQFTTGSSKQINIEVFDLSGRKIFHNLYNNQGFFNQEIHLQNATTGIYLISVSDGEKKTIKKISVQ